MTHDVKIGFFKIKFLENDSKKGNHEEFLDLKSNFLVLNENETVGNEGEVEEKAQVVS